MKRQLLILFIAALSFTANAQYTKLLDFDWTSNGAHPCYGELYYDGTFFYGTTLQGGSAGGNGTIFKIKPDGTGYAKLYDFDGTIGKFPHGQLISDGTFLYGTTAFGGIYGYGIVFKIKPDGTGFAKLYEFNGTNGRNPRSSLISDGTFLYGTTSQGGTSGYGVVFKVKPDGTGFAKLLDFNLTNGFSPIGALISDGTYIYGTTTSGGTSGYGTVFKIMPDGTGYTKLLDFDGTNGRAPKGALVSDGTFLYGTTSEGGTNAYGTVFKIKSDGTGFTKLFDFNGTDGNGPLSTLIFNGGFLYGTTAAGGSNNMGTIFKIKPDGSNYTRLLDFAGASNGLNPYGAFVSVGNFLYGTTNAGGANDNGTIYKFDACVTTSTVSATACSSYTVPSGDEAYTTSGTYKDTIPNAAGCDSIITIELTIANNTGTDEVTACDSYTWIDGNIYTTSNNTATHVLQNAAGCDSTVTLDLIINNSTTGTDTVTACNSFTWIDGITYTSSNNTATYVLPGGNAAGCDSTVTLDLTIETVDTSVTQSGNTLTSAAASASYQWLDCDNGYSVIPSETNQSYTPSADGNYAVIVTQNSCSDTSGCFNVIVTGISKYVDFNTGVWIFPNPNNGTFVIKANAEGSYRIINSLGQYLQTIRLRSSESYIIRNLENGIYFIANAEGAIQQRIVVIQ